MENISNTTLNSPVASQDDVNKMNKTQQLSEPDQLSVMRREVKFKKIMFSNLPSNFSLFRQYNITTKVMKLQNHLHYLVKTNQKREENGNFWPKISKKSIHGKRCRKNRF